MTTDDEMTRYHRERDVPAPLQKKLELLRHFTEYMDDFLTEGECDHMSYFYTVYVIIYYASKFSIFLNGRNATRFHEACIYFCLPSET